MLGTWNTIIKTPYMQIYSILTISEDENGVSLKMVTEPFDMNISFKNIERIGNVLKASGSDARGMTQELELNFENNSFSGALTSPFMGKTTFNGKKGRGLSLSDKLEDYGEKSVQENRYWKGKWIWDVKQPEANENSEHVLVYFRRTFRVPEGVNPNLKLDITADSRYRLFVNGLSVTVGPCKGDRHVQYYETVDVSKYLVQGENVLAVKVVRYPSLEPFKEGEGGPISIWRSQSAGLFVEASLKDDTGLELESLHSGSEWKVYRHKGYRHAPKTLIKWMGGVEEVDGQGAPHNWELPDFDDSSWIPAIPFAETRGFAGTLSPWNLVPRPIPFMYEKERNFIQVTKVEERDETQARLFLQGSQPLLVPAYKKLMIEMDAGELMTGYLTVGVQGGRGSVIRMIPSECYEPEDSDPERMRNKGNREDTSGKLIGEPDVYHVAGIGNREGSEEIYEPFWFRTFRYVRLEIETNEEPLELLYANYRETGYPLDVKAQFQCSDKELNILWDLSVRTLKRCMHETYEDCPYYEQLQYSMDSRLMMLFTYLVSADDRMSRRTIADYYRSRQSDGMLQSRYPSTQPQIIPSFALYWIDMLAEHYEYNKDHDLIVTYRPAMLQLLDWYHERLTPEGIVGVTSNRYWTYFDWVTEWPFGAPPESIDRPMYLLSLMYAASLRKAANLLRVTGWNDAASELEKRADNVCNAVRHLAWSEENQLFRDLPDTEIYSQHSQIMAVLAGVVAGEEAKRLMERTLNLQKYRVSLPYSYLLIQALKKTGLQHRIFDLWDRWRVFLSQGLTTLPEMEVNPRSDCHAWSAVPLAEFPGTILGIKPIEAGFNKILIEPQLGKLQWAKGSVATVKGMIEVDWKLDQNQFHLKAKLPEGVTALIKLPDGTKQTLSGEEQFTCSYMPAESSLPL
jgi:alpha-L-rhamnosidase